MKKLLIIILLISVGVLAAMKLLAEKERVANQPTALSLNYTIKTVTTKEEQVAKKRSFLATIKSDKEVRVMTKMSGTINRLHVSEADEVKKGDLLVEIDDTTIKSNLKTLYKNLDVQKSDVEYYTTVQQRNERLYKADAISKENYDASKLQLLSKEAALDATKEKIKALQSDLKYLRVKAPFSGVISSIYLHKGDLATAQKPILALSENKQKMTFAFATTKEPINIGDVVLVQNQQIGRISKIYPNVKNNLNIAEVKLSTILHLKNDSHLSIEVVTDSQKGCSLPLESLLHTKDATYVLNFQNNKFEKRAVDVLIEDDARAIISPCVEGKVAVASESKLSILPFYQHITLVGESHEE